MSDYLFIRSQSHRRDILHLSLLNYIDDLVLRSFFLVMFVGSYPTRLQMYSSWSNTQKAYHLHVQCTFSLILGVVFPKLSLFIGAFYLISLLLFCWTPFVHTISIRLPEPEQKFCRLDYLGNTLFTIVNCLREKLIFFPLKANSYQVWTKWCSKQTIKFVFRTNEIDNNWWNGSNINEADISFQKFSSIVILAFEPSNLVYSIFNDYASMQSFKLPLTRPYMHTNLTKILIVELWKFLEWDMRSRHDSSMNIQNGESLSSKLFRMINSQRMIASWHNRVSWNESIPLLTYHIV